MSSVCRSLSSADVMEARMRRENNWGTGSAVAYQNSYYPIHKLGRAPLVSFLPPMARQMLPCFPGYLLFFFYFFVVKTTRALFFHTDKKTNKTTTTTSFMGKLSTTTKNLRLATGVTKESRNMRATMPEVVMEYIPALRTRILDDLHNGRSQEAAEFLSGQYHLDRLDWDFIQDIDTYKKIRNPTAHKTSDTAVKKTFTTASKRILEADKTRKKGYSAPANDAVPDDEDADEDSAEDDDDEPSVKKGAKKASSKPARKKSAAKPARKKAATTPKAPAKKRGRQNTK